MCQLVVLVLLAQTQDALIPATATTVTRRQCHQMTLKTGCHMVIHGFSSIANLPSAYGRIRLKLVETFQVSEKRISISLHARGMLST